MKTRTTQFFPLLLIATLTHSCIKEIGLRPSATGNALVVNALFSPDSLLQVNVSQVAGILDDGFVFIENAQVEWWEGEEQVETLPYIGNGNYRASRTPSAYLPNKIIVSAPGFTAVSAMDSIPFLPVVKDARYTFGKTFDGRLRPRARYGSTPNCRPACCWKR